ncbi:MAG TPA: protein translocase subunit SecF [Clostridiaceae bacterium]|nr:protein translocase subunit SecF [Clostridiaceae bacterium]
MIDFVGKRKIFFTIPIIIIIAGIIGLIVNGGLNYDIQFQGGTILEIEMPDDTFDANEIGAAISELVNKTVSPQKVKTYNPQEGQETMNILMLKVPSESTLTDEEIEKIFNLLREDYNVATDAQVQVQSVEPFIAVEIRQKGLLAISIASLLILAYIWWRFSTISGLPAAVTALLALLHDAAIMLSAYAIFNIPINESFIAAVLTILGYSINDTIIIYDRIRENRNKMRKASLEELTNISLNQTLNRTLYTTITTLIAVITVYVFATIYKIQSIKDFTFPLTIGLVSGVYSTLFIATPLWMMWKKKQDEAKVIVKQTGRK